MSELITVASFDFAHQAELARTYLESEGIRAFVIGGNSVTTNPFLLYQPGVRVQLQVTREDFEDAVRLLAETPATAELPERSEPDPAPVISARTSLAWASISPILGLLVPLWLRIRRRVGKRD